MIVSEINASSAQGTAVFDTVEGNITAFTFDTFAPGNRDIRIERLLPSGGSLVEGGTKQSHVVSVKNSTVPSGGETIIASTGPGTPSTIKPQKTDPTDGSGLIRVKTSFAPQKRWEFLQELSKQRGADNYLSPNETLTNDGRAFETHLREQSEKGILRRDLMTLAPVSQSSAPPSSAGPNAFPPGALCDAFEQMTLEAQSAFMGLGIDLESHTESRK